MVLIFYMSYVFIYFLIFISLYSEPDVLKEVKQKLDLGSVKFEVITFYTFINLFICLS